MSLRTECLQISQIKRLKYQKNFELCPQEKKNCLKEKKSRMQHEIANKLLYNDTIKNTYTKLNTVLTLNYTVKLLGFF